MVAQERRDIEARWLRLTREILPAVAQGRGWPVHFDHCFQRIFLDMACGGVWYDHVPRRPAYAHADFAILCRAIDLAEAVMAGEADLVALNRQSLEWRRRDRKNISGKEPGGQRHDRRG